MIGDQDDVVLEQENVQNALTPESQEKEESLTYSQEYYILNRERLLEERKEREAEAKFGDYSARLVKRPQKNFLWGYGTEIHDESNQNGEGCFTHGKLPTIKELINFCEIYQMKDIKVVNLKTLKEGNTENYAVVASGYSMRHLYSTAKSLCQQVKALECPQVVNIPTIAGCKDESWLMIVIKQVQVHLILDDYRDDLDLEFRWMNPPPPEMKKKWKVYEKLKKRGASYHPEPGDFNIKNEFEADLYGSKTPQEKKDKAAAAKKREENENAADTESEEKSS